ncbi:MAG: zinc-ribbon domain-containing protein [Victivallaceae bacterium]
MRITCPKCKQEYDIDDAYNGRPVECETCGTSFLAGVYKPEAQAARPPSAIEAKPQGKILTCIDCGAEISSRAETCPHCGRPYRVSFSLNNICAILIFLVGSLISLSIFVSAKSVMHEILAAQFFTNTMIFSFYFGGVRTR